MPIRTLAQNCWMTWQTRLRRGAAWPAASTVRLEGHYPVGKPDHASVERHQPRRHAAGRVVYLLRSGRFPAGGRLQSGSCLPGEEIELSQRLKRLARTRRKRIVILHRHPLVTSARKMQSLHALGAYPLPPKGRARAQAHPEQPRRVPRVVRWEAVGSPLASGDVWSGWRRGGRNPKPEIREPKEARNREGSKRVIRLRLRQCRAAFDFGLQPGLAELIYRLPSWPGGLFNGAVVQQQTLNRPASYSGIGLHSGNRVTMTFLPAPPNTGIRFRRVDLEGKPEIEARAENVVETNRSTTLAKGNTRIHTVEHVLATFAGYGIDNAIVELDANEPPIADGSAREYCKMVQEAGIVPQDERREPYMVTAPIELEMGETVMTLFPDEAFKISCTSADKQGRFTQFYSLEVSPGDLGTRPGARPHVLLLRGDRVPDQERPDQGRQPGERGGDSRRRGADHRAAALPG